MPKFEPVLMANMHRPDSHTLKVYESTGGYQALKKVLKESTQESFRDLIKNSGLRGRGGAGFPTGLKWTFLPKDHPGPIYLCINADESEPGTFNNRYLMELDPHQVIEGTILSSFATKASTAYIYLRIEYPTCYEHLEAAIAECYAAGYLGKNILGSGYSLDMYMHRGAAAYICGEETGLIESLEGKRAWPRIKPPFPAVEGLFRKPTVVNNVETVACVKQIADRGVSGSRASVCPPIRTTRATPVAMVEALLSERSCEQARLLRSAVGHHCRQLIDEYGGGVWKGRKAKAAIPGGISMGLLTEAELDTPLDFNGPGKVGCLGVARGRGRG